MNLPDKLAERLQDRKRQHIFRSLGSKASGLCDFSSNDYLGFAASQDISAAAEELIAREAGFLKNGATGSRLLTGNSRLHTQAEDFIATFHNAPSALIFNSGYDANIGFFSAVAQRGDLIVYDELIHASIRDGIGLSNARAYKFRHNSIEDLQLVLERNRKTVGEVYIVTESVFSMDGDLAPLKELTLMVENNGFHLVVDEAHATGVFGRGLIEELGLETHIFARIHTFGKALGCHGAAILGSVKLKDYLVNFARSFIYTTALPPHAIATLIAAYQYLDTSGPVAREQLHSRIALFRSEIVSNQLQSYFLESKSAIQSCIIPGNDAVKEISDRLKQRGYEVKSILSPTVKRGRERLRFCLHSFNSEAEIRDVLRVLAIFIQ